MTLLVTLQQASDHLRRDTTDDDTDLTLKVKAASNAVLTYLRNTSYAYIPSVDSSGAIVRDSSGYPVPAQDSSGAYLVQTDVQHATLLLIGEFYKNREAEQEGAIDSQWGYGYLPRSVVALLYPYRDPALA